MNIIASYTTDSCYVTQRMVITVPDDMPVSKLWQTALQYKNRFCGGQLMSIEIILTENAQSPDNKKEIE